MTIRLQFDRIGPGVEIGPHRHGVETIVYLAAGELVFEHGEDLERRTVVHAGDVLYEAPAEYHLVRNESHRSTPSRCSRPPSPIRAGRARCSAAGRRTTSRSDAAAMPARPRPAASAGGCSSARRLRHGHLHGQRDRGGRPARSTPGTGTRAPSRRSSCSRAAASSPWTTRPRRSSRSRASGSRPASPTASRTPAALTLRYYVCSVPGLDPTRDREPAEAPRRRLDA